MCSFIEVAVYGIQRPTSLYKKNNNSREVIVFTHVKKHGSFTYIIVGNKEQQGKNKNKNENENIMLPADVLYY